MSVLGLITDLITISQGGVPIDQIARAISSVVRARRRGKTRAQARKKEMRKRRRFVDTVIMEHERRVQKQNLENRINETKDLLEKIKKDREERATAIVKISKIARNKRAVNKYGNQEDDYQEENEEQQDEQKEHLNKVQQIIADRQGEQGQSWANKIDNNKGGSSREI